MTIPLVEYISKLNGDGHCLTTDVVEAGPLARLIEAISAAQLLPGPIFGGISSSARNIIERIPAIADVACSSEIRTLVEPVLGPSYFAVRGVLFDKTPDANWKVPWHQDLSIAVKKRRDLEGFGPWSTKAGVPHVQPPVAILEQMLTVRLHLDDCFDDNGPLRVLPGTHLLGKLPPSRVAALRDSIPAVHCVAAAGSALIIRPLTLHASSIASSPAHRRVVHIEYAACELPHGLEWFTSLRPNQ